jgi:exoribonuclease-2
MGTKALPHAGIGVPAYAWSTSPLRRYTDLVNQWQILAAVRHGSTAALAAPFKPKDAELFAIISNFESAYAAYNAYQSSMERFWTLKYIQQQGLQELCATLIKDTLVRADDLPLVLNVPAVQDAARGARFLIRLGALDLMSLDIQGTVLQRLDLDAATGTCDALADDEDAEDPMPLALEVVLEDDPPHAPTTESGP